MACIDGLYIIRASSRYPSLSQTSPLAPAFTLALVLALSLYSYSLHNYGLYSYGLYSYGGGDRVCKGVGFWPAGLPAFFLSGWLHVLAHRNDGFTLGEVVS